MVLVLIYLGKTQTLGYYAGVLAGANKKICLEPNSVSTEDKIAN